MVIKLGMYAKTKNALNSTDMKKNGNNNYELKLK